MTNLTLPEQIARSADSSRRNANNTHRRGSQRSTGRTIDGWRFLEQDDIDDWVHQTHKDAFNETAHQKKTFERTMDLAGPRATGQQEKSREPRAFDGNRGSLNTAASRGVLYE